MDLPDYGAPIGVVHEMNCHGCGIGVEFTFGDPPAEPQQESLAVRLDEKSGRCPLHRFEVDISEPGVRGRVQMEFRLLDDLQYRPLAGSHQVDGALDEDRQHLGDTRARVC